jgi:hypothetical protein
MGPESVVRGNRLLNLVGSGRVKELRAPIPYIKQSKERRGDHGDEQQAAMMLGQGETGEG